MVDPITIVTANMAAVPMGFLCAFVIVDVRERAMSALHCHRRRRVLESEFRKFDEWLEQMKKPAEAGFAYRTMA